MVCTIQNILLAILCPKALLDYCLAQILSSVGNSDNCVAACVQGFSLVNALVKYSSLPKRKLRDKKFKILQKHYDKSKTTITFSLGQLGMTKTEVMDKHKFTLLVGPQKTLTHGKIIVFSVNSLLNICTGSPDIVTILCLCFQEALP